MLVDLRLCWLRIPHCWKSNVFAHLSFWPTIGGRRILYSLQIFILKVVKFWPDIEHGL